MSGRIYWEGIGSDVQGGQQYSSARASPVMKSRVLLDTLYNYLSVTMSSTAPNIVPAR